MNKRNFFFMGAFLSQDIVAKDEEKGNSTSRGDFFIGVAPGKRLPSACIEKSIVLKKSIRLISDLFKKSMGLEKKHSTDFGSFPKKQEP